MSKRPDRTPEGGKKDAADASQLYERELLYGEAIETVTAVMAERGISQTRLAERLGVSQARISKMLSGRENLTLRSLADLGWALGLRFELAALVLGDRSTTPAANDPDGPAWLRRETDAGLVAEKLPPQVTGEVQREASPALRPEDRSKAAGGMVKRIDVVRRGNYRIDRSGGRSAPNPKASRKPEIVSETVEVAKQRRKPTSVRIHKPKGQIDEERTYPRSADPRRSEG